VKNKKQLQHQTLTIEKLKSYPGLENLDDKEAEEVISSIEKFSLLMFQMFKRIQNERFKS
jgi:hypothetical protein